MLQSTEAGTLTPDELAPIRRLADSCRQRADAAATWGIFVGHPELLLTEDRSLWPGPDYSVGPALDDNDPFHPASDATPDRIRDLRARAAACEAAIAAKDRALLPNGFWVATHDYDDFIDPDQDAFDLDADR